MRKKILAIAASAVLLVLGFQNCSQKTSSDANPTDAIATQNPSAPATISTGTKLLKEYKSKSSTKYFFTGSLSDQTAVENSGLFDSKGTITLYATQDSTNYPLCRFWVTTTQSHFYTIDVNLCNTLKSNSSFRYEGIEGYALQPSGGVCSRGLAAVYRVFTGEISPVNGRAHRFTGSLSEKQNLVNTGWVDEGIAFCVVDASTRE